MKIQIRIRIKRERGSGSGSVSTYWCFDIHNTDLANDKVLVFTNIRTAGYKRAVDIMGLVRNPLADF
jgi:hypothetical protein